MAKGNVRIRLYKNLDERQELELYAPSVADMIIKIEKWIKMHNAQCDGLTVGRPDVNKWSTLSFTEGERSASLAWECDTYDRGTRVENEVGTFEEMCEVFLDRCRDHWNFVHA